MPADFNQKVLILIVALFLGAFLTVHVALTITAGVVLVWGLHNAQSVLSLLKRLYSWEHRKTAPQLRPITLCHVYDPETNTMTAVPRAIIMRLFSDGRDTPLL